MKLAKKVTWIISKIWEEVEKMDHCLSALYTLSHNPIQNLCSLTADEIYHKWDSLYMIVASLKVF